ncbi:MAG TPA: substrate-binding domain-containing protein [Candidatus Nanopelagicaceae bacterium]|nr:substrate-binding domain-containing protein [Candidatus Nanopelagicaceae bacterium]
MILPDSASSPRYEQGDRPALQSAITAAGFTADIQNAQGDTAKYGTIADQQLAGGCGVMILDDLNGAAVQVTVKAKAQGIPVIAYDRPIAGSDYYVSFDNVKVGAMEGQTIVDALKAEGKNPATASVVYVGGDVADGNAKMFMDGAVAAMSAAGIKPAVVTPGVWDGAKSATYFEQAYTKLKGKVDAVWVANDTNAAGVITILDKFHKVVPVSGQDASLAGLQNILLGKQTSTVYKPFKLEADSAARIAIALLQGTTPTVNSQLPDGTPFDAQTPILIRAKDIAGLVAQNAVGMPTAADICTGAVAAACTKYGVK